MDKQMVLPVRGAARSALDTITLPSTHSVVVGPAAIAISETLSTKKVAYFQFLPRLEDSDVVTAAELRLTAAAALGSATGSHTIKALDFWTALDATVTAAATLASAVRTPVVWDEGETYTYDVMAVVQAAIADPDYSRGQPITLSVESEETLDREIVSVTADPLASPTLAITWTKSDTADEDSPELQVMRGLWALLEGHRDFTGIVAPGNRIKFIGENRDPIKAQIMSADVPEVRIVPGAGGTLEAVRTTSSSSGTLQFSIQVATGDKRVDADGEGLHPVKFAIFRALADWREVLPGLKWRSLPFVQRVAITSVNDGSAQVDSDRGIKGWSSIWTVSVDVFLSTTVLNG